MKEEKFVCMYCGESFETNEDRATHNRARHPAVLNKAKT
jgi:hypothetical protein